MRNLAKTIIDAAADNPAMAESILGATVIAAAKKLLTENGLMPGTYRDRHFPQRWLKVKPSGEYIELTDDLYHPGISTGKEYAHYIIADNVQDYEFELIKNTILQRLNKF